MALPRALNPNNTFFKWLSRLSCIAFLCTQCALLNYYVITYIGPLWAIWICIDIFSIVLFTAAAITSHNKFYAKREKGRLVGNGELPLGYLAWGVYSLQLAARSGVIFGSTSVVKAINPTMILGPSVLKTTFALSSIIFVQLVLMHHDAPHSSCRHEYVNDVAQSTALDILDSVSVLNALYDTSSTEFEIQPLHISVIVVSGINLVLPSIPLFILSRNHFGKRSVSAWFQIAYRIAHILFGDIAMFVVRVMVVSSKDQLISVFAIKNLISLVLNIKWLLEAIDSKDELDEDNDEDGHDHEHNPEVTDADTDAVRVAMTGAGEPVKSILLLKQQSHLSTSSHCSKEMCMRHRRECACSCHKNPLGRSTSREPTVSRSTSKEVAIELMKENVEKSEEEKQKTIA